MKESPFKGSEKPEPLKFDLAGKWSRRINDEHRILYTVEKDFIQVHSLKGHY
jgi:toxin YoeB